MIALVATAVTLALRTAAPDVTVQSPRVAGRPVNARLPVDFRLARLGGGARVDLARLVSGHVAVINLFASWCPACQKELEAFGAASAEFHKEVRFVGVDTSEPDPRRSLRLLAQARATYPVALDSASLAVAGAWGVSNLPVTFFVRANGTIAAEHLGAESSSALRGEIEALLRADRGTT